MVSRVGSTFGSATQSVTKVKSDRTENIKYVGHFIGFDFSLNSFEHRFQTTNVRYLKFLG